MEYDLVKLSRKFRKVPSTAEKLLWQHLRSRNILNCKFRRQHVFDRYIVDFICFSHKLIIEADGEQHMHNIEYDNERTNFLAGLGFKVIRFWNKDILYDTKRVINDIYIVLNSCTDRN